MRLPGFHTVIENYAPRFLGAFFCAGLLLVSTACKKSATPDWSTAGGEAPLTTPHTETAKTESTPAPANTKVPARAVSAEAPTETVEKRPRHSSTQGLRFINYNVENWLTMDRRVRNKVLPGTPKPESEKQAVIAILARHSPDVVGLCEIGKATDLAEIQERLKAAGLDLPHTHYTGGSDPVRHLGLLSKFPITSTSKPAETEFSLEGQTHGINRGILDATVDVRGKNYRFIGVHLKSKRDSEQGDQEAIRLNEARLLRRHVDSILRKNVDARLIVYGDFNDTRGNAVIKTITGKYQDPTSLTMIPAKDSSQNTWTQHWAAQDLYSRFDFIMVTRALRKEVDFPAAKVIDDADWSKASDHRPVMAVFR